MVMNLQRSILYLAVVSIGPTMARDIANIASKIKIKSYFID
jgi:hypothetical protein